MEGCGRKKQGGTVTNPKCNRPTLGRHAALEQRLRWELVRHRLPANQALSVACGQAIPAVYGDMDRMFANMLSSGLCIAIHQPQTHLCNL